MPSTAATNAKAIRTKKGVYTIIQSTNQQNKIISQILLGPDSHENRMDANGDGIWDHWELEKQNITVMADNPINGHYSSLQYVFRMQKGFLRTNFVYEAKTRTYLMLNKNFETYKVLKAEDIVIGRCSQLSELAKLAATWNNYALNVNNKQFENIVDDPSSSFIDKSCRNGKFKASYNAIKSGMAQVLASSVRDGDGRFLQCMDNHGLGIHADRIRSYLYSKINSNTSRYVIANQVPSLDSTLSANQSKSPAGGAGGAVGNVVDVSHNGGVGELAASERENTDISKDQVRESIKTEASDLPMVRCEYSEIIPNAGIKRGSFAENVRQITLSRNLGETIPAHLPKYGTPPKKMIAKVKVDVDDYAKAFFHELVHSSFIENEEFTESIENCCSLQNGYDISNPACGSMQYMMERAAGHQSFIHAINLNNPRKYEDYHQELVTAIKSKEDAYLLEDSIISRFKTKKEHCDEQKNKCYTTEGFLLNSKLECEKENGANTASCLAKFNNGFSIEMHKLYKEECRTFVSRQKPLQCDSLATKFVNVFGDCGNKVATNFKLESKWQYVLKLLTGEHGIANDKELCQCFNITAHSKYLESIDSNSSADSDGVSTPSYQVPGTNLTYVPPEEYSVPGSTSYNPPGQSAKNNSNLSKQPVTKEMLEEMSPVPNSQITKEFTNGYERRSTVVMDSAVAVLNRVKNEILPRAEASVGTRGVESGMMSRLNQDQNVGSGNTSNFRIPDPFASGSASTPASGAVLQSGLKPVMVSTSGVTAPAASADSSFSGARPASTVNTTSGISSPSAIGSSSQAGHKAGNRPNSSGLNSAQATAAGGSKQSEQKTAGADSRRGISSRSGQKDAGLPVAVSAKSSASSAAPAANNSRRGVGALRSVASAAKPSVHAPNHGIPIFTNTDDLLRFLTGPYRAVSEALQSREFIKTLIEHKIKVVNHAKVRIGANNPTYILQFNPANGSLNIVKWK